MEKVIIAGGGFAGTAAARVLAGRNLEIVLIDPKPTFDFLPLLPDVLGLRLSPDVVSQEYARLARRHGFTFREERVTSIDPFKKEIATESGADTCDYMIVSTGAETNYFGQEAAAVDVFPLRSLSHVTEILECLDIMEPARAVVVGGGYTGMETASQLRRYARRKHIDLDIMIVELGETILSQQDEWVRDYMRRAMERLGVTIKTECTVDEFVEDGVRLTTGEFVERCIVVWNAGVKIVNPFSGSALRVDDKGQVIVDEFLRAAEGCYVAGDVSRFEEDGEPLPMASYLAVQQGKCAARNILRELRGRSPRPYSPRFYGVVIPLANGTGFGTLLGVRVKGLPGALVHHAASFFRIHDAPTRFTYLADLMRRGIGL